MTEVTVSGESGSPTSDPRGFLSVVLSGAIKFGASDVHIRSGNPVMLRIDGVIRSLKGAPELCKPEIEALIDEMLPDYHKNLYR